MYNVYINVWENVDISYKVFTIVVAKTIQIVD